MRMYIMPDFLRVLKGIHRIISLDVAIISVSFVWALVWGVSFCGRAETSEITGMQHPECTVF